MKGDDDDDAGKSGKGDGKGDDGKGKGDDGKGDDGKGKGKDKGDDKKGKGKGDDKPAVSDKYKDALTAFFATLPKDDSTTTLQASVLL